jgi:hypothetical protein
VTVWLEDSARNVLGAWAIETRKAGLAEAAVLSPFSTPYKKDWKPGAVETVQRLHEAGVSVWLDPETHVLQMPSVGAFRYYQTWDLWSGVPGMLNTTAAQRDHTERVFAAQDALGLPHVAPTILLHSAQSQTSQEALDLGRIAVELDPGCRLAIAGDSTFWSAGHLLDGHVGALAQLDPAGWFVTVARQLSVVPVPATAAETYGLCRTVRALSEDGPVHVSHGDLAGLPAVAAGGTSLGAGWDVRQKVSSYASYLAPEPQGDGGGWFGQATFEGLLSCLVRNDAQVLFNRQPALAAQLLPGALPPGNAAKPPWIHHVGVLQRACEALTVPHEQAYSGLRSRYEAAIEAWGSVATALGSPSRANEWIAPLLDGLLAYGADEGY